MKIALWISGRLSAQSVLTWAQEQGHEVKCFVTMAPSEGKNLPWTTDNLDDVKKVSDQNKIDLLFKTVKDTPEKNYQAIDALLVYANNKYQVEAIAVAPITEIAHPIRNEAKKLNWKVLVYPKG